MNGVRDRLNSDVLARKATINFVVLSIIASLMTMVGWYWAGMASWQWAVSIAIFSIFLVIMLVCTQLSYRWSATLFLASAAVIILASGYGNQILANSGARFEAFNGTKLAVIAVALIAPTPAWVGFLVIGFCSVTSVVQYANFPVDIRASFPVQEPWSMILYCVIAFFILRYRLRSIELQRKVAQMFAERKALDDLARIFLGMRDLTNTPLQAVEITSKLLASGHLSQQEASEYLEKSMIRLREVSELLTIYEKNIDWNHTTSSFDAITSLHVKLGEMSAQGLANSQ